MDRRTFLKTSPAAAAAVAASSSLAAIMSGDHSEAHAKMAESQAEMHAVLGFGIDSRKSAVSVTIIPFAYHETHEIVFDLPPGFVPTHVDSSYMNFECYQLQIVDDEGRAFEVGEAAFNAGALALWRPTAGTVRARVQYTVSLSVLPTVTVTLYGDIVP